MKMKIRAKKAAALLLSVVIMILSVKDALASEEILPAIIENIPYVSTRLEGGRIIAKQEGFCILFFDTEKGTAAKIELEHIRGEIPGECVISDNGIFMKAENMTVEKVAGEWKIFGGKFFDFSGKQFHELPQKEKRAPKITEISVSGLPAAEEKIDNLRVRWVGEKILAITDGEKLFYYCTESGILTEKSFANRKTKNI